MSAQLLRKLCLGTAQFGSNYGVANDSGKISRDEAFEILDYAHDSGIRYIDTASSYGESEEIVGDFMVKSKKEFNVISKFPPLDTDSRLKIDCCCKQTLSSLKQSNIYGYLAHKLENVSSDKGLWQEMKDIKENGLAHKIGLSIYRAREMQWVLSNSVGVDILQVPYNIFDQRFDKYFSDLKQMNIEIFARSIFLQGLFFLKADSINKDFKAAKYMMEKLRRISSDHNIPVHAICLCFAMANPLLDRIIIGVDTLEHLKQNLDSIIYFDKIKNLYELLISLKLDSEEIILPFNWK